MKSLNQELLLIVTGMKVALMPYASPAGTPFEMRALPPTTNMANLNTYRVVKPVNAETATIAPAFNQIGLGTQHKLSKSVGNLIKSGHLERIK